MVAQLPPVDTQMPHKQPRDLLQSAPIVPSEERWGQTEAGWGFNKGKMLKAAPPRRISGGGTVRVARGHHELRSPGGSGVCVSREPRG